MTDIKQLLSTNIYQALINAHSPTAGNPFATLADISGGGGGTVTSVSVVTNQGVSGSVANPTTTPAITLSLGVLTGVTSFNGLVVTANTGVITTGTMGTGSVIAGTTMTLGSDASYDTYYRGSTGVLTRLANGTTGQVLSATTGAAPSWITNGVGTVTSFSAGSGNSLFTTSVATSTTTPALSFSFNTQSANLVYAGPSSGIAAVPTFRALVAADLPTFTQGSVIFAGASGVLSQDNTNFFWNDSTDSLGIGIASPAAALHVVTSSTTLPRGILSDEYVTGTTGARIDMRKARGTVTSPIVIVTGDVLGSFSAWGYGTGSAFVEAGKILFTSIGTIGSVIQSTIQLQTANASGVITTGLTIDQNQNTILVGTLTASTVIGGTTSSSTLTLESTSGTGTTDAIIFKTGSQVEAARFNTSGFLGIGQSNPQYALDILQNTNGDAQIQLLNPSSGSSAHATITLGQTNSSASSMILGFYNSGYSGSGAINANTALIYTSAAGGISIADDNAAGTINFYTAGTTTKRWSISSSGQLLGGTAGTGISIKSGANCKIGTGTLSGGTVTITNTSVTTSSLIFLQDTTSGSLINVGALAVVAGSGSFIVTSTNTLDASTFNYIIFETN